MSAAPPRARARKLVALVSLAACACLAAYALAAHRAASAQRGDVLRQSSESEGGEETEVSVYGRAVFEGTNRPVRRAQVVLFGEGGRTREHGTLTDADGRFRVRGVPPGRYVAFVNLSGVMSPTGFVGLDELRAGAPDFRGPEVSRYFEEIEVDGKADKEVTIYARRGAAIGGKVSYANGDPAVNVRLHLLRRRDKRLTKFLPGATPAAIFNLTTDDRGVFRVAGLPPGEYVVGVSELADHGGESGMGMSEYVDTHLISALTGDPLLVTYHPSATRAADAAVVRVEAGDERTDVDITVVERELRTLAGVVRGRSDRRPLPNVRVLLVRKAEGEGAPAPPASHGYEATHTDARTDAEGRWRLKDIPDGEYTLHLAPPEDYEPSSAATANMNYNGSTNLNGNVVVNANTSVLTSPRRRKRYAPARRELRVTADVDELSIELGEGARVTGTVAVEGGSTPEYSSIFLAPVAPDPGVPAADQMPGATVFRTEFTIEGVPQGSYRLYPQHLMRGDGGGALYVKSINWNGRDLLREPLEVAEGASIDGVRVVYGRDPARLRVRVLRPGDRQPVGGALVLLLPPGGAPAPSAQPQGFQCVTGDDGSCEINAAPGDYAVITLSNPRAPRAAYDFAADIKRRAAAAPRLTLRAAETKTLDLTPPDEN